jgi:cytochrome P450
MMRWTRSIFRDVFLNLSNDPQVRAVAMQSASELRAYLNARISQRKAELAAGALPPDDLLTRMLLLQKSTPWLDDAAIRRNLSGLLLGAVDTTSKASVQALDQLLRFPAAFREAQECARRGDAESVKSYLFEALRFDPLNPIFLRFARSDAALGGTTIPSGSLVFAGSLSAMFDPAAFADPMKFKPGRDGYLHFGRGLHMCFGRYINEIQLPELLMSVLRLPGLRRATGRAGWIAYDGPFPDRLVLEFDR